MDVRSLEHPTLKVPYELLNKRYRTAQKVIEREVARLGEAEKQGKNQAVLSKKEALQYIEDMLASLESYKERTSAAIESELAAADNLRERLDHLKGGIDKDLPGHVIWKRTRVERMLVEHFLRVGFYSTANKLAESSGITELTNITIFNTAREVEESLQRKDTSKVLQWCYDNRSKLRKVKSTLEFNVRMQEFVEKIKAGERMEAVMHARKYLASDKSFEKDRSEIAEKQLEVMQQAMGLLAFPANTSLPRYSELLKDSCWDDLINQFRSEIYRIHQLANQSVFSVAIQAGLSGLKTSKCYNRPSSEERNTECPICQDPINQLAANLPFAHCSHSKLICYISGKPLNEHNHPIMLPNGYIYGEDALQQMAIENDGQIVCPRTKAIFNIGEIQKVYVM